MISFSKVDKLPELTLQEIQQYLSSGLFRGIGKKTAQTLVNYFGYETLSVLDANPLRLESVPGLGKSRIAAIKKAWSENKANPTRGIIAQLLGVGTSLRLTLKICEHYGHRTALQLKSDPYKLIDDIEGIGFKTADELAMSLGISVSSETRYEKGLLHVLKEALSEGNCFLPESHLLGRAVSLLERPHHTPDYKSLNTILGKLVEKQTLVYGEVSNSVYQKAAYRAELSVALKIQTLINRPTYPTLHLENWLADFEAPEYRELSRLTTEQTSALLMAVKHPISIITGGPGRGKTYVLQALVQWLTFMGANIALAAPTGKAANRMKEATGMSASTIHRLLQWQGIGQNFYYNEDNPLTIDWLIVDEFSMVDIFLFNSLLKALPETTRILLVGDSDQLPSVGPGMVLRDLLNSEIVPTTRLQKIHRQRKDSPIIYAASEVNFGTVPPLDKFNQAESWMDVGECAMLEASSPEMTAKSIVSLVASMKKENVDLNQNVIVLAPQKEGAAGVNNLNKLLQPIFNPQKPNQPEVVLGSVVYRVGDRVIQLKNRYDTLPPVMNGETGQVVAVDEKKEMVKISWEGGAIVDYYPGFFDQIMHSFCITCHKSQGSEFQFVIFPLLMANYRMLTRQLLYTTMTRAQGTFIAVGQPEALKIAVLTDKPAKRFTGLMALLISPIDELTRTFLHLSKAKAVASATPPTVTVASRLQSRQLTASPGQMTTIGTIALQMYEEKYGHRPSKQLEQVGKFKFKTYHYEISAVELIDSAIDLVMREE
ncbi:MULTISPECIES: ATP-dependent RecD-like DNA helicase [Nostoc]|uniref:ATP-dependent RecD-like DNA helicase n=1 Tax=Nostoc paludosum FACHB-159 TaxID=2692908 RepID=A0ABR8KJY4_9NOSO|nr:MULTISPECIES: ATP-dependent RecD-like DNA helicase [Nostoc]MBD2683049.1 ATP-dependent RecD-like DNA helicase [Nostoc sp. FACHB-857]MBD2739390.1 ATP-dependent RecD-like DNA helicase [Nostoc paludosum FACHB-159]